MAKTLNERLLEIRRQTAETITELTATLGEIDAALSTLGIPIPDPPKRRGRPPKDATNGE